MEIKKTSYNHRRAATSSEIVCEAKGFLNVANGLRVIKDSRRPVTPHSSNHRRLFGSVTMPGRPLSSINTSFLKSNAYFLPEVEHQQKSQDEEQQQKYKNDSTKLPLLKSLQTSAQCQPKDFDLRAIYDQKSNKKSLKSKNSKILTNKKLEQLAKLSQEFNTSKKLSDSTESAILQSLTELKSSKLKIHEEAEFLNYLFLMAECESPEILTAIAEIMLLLEHSGQNLTGACKIIYKISKNSENDKILVQSNLPELLLEKGIARINPIDEVESIVYGYGALRFLMFNKAINDSRSSQTIGNRLLSKGIIQVLTIHLQLFNDIAVTNKLQDQHFHALFQMSETIREAFNFIIPGTPDHIKLDDSVSLVGPHLLTLLQFCANDMEMQLQILRTLSVISETDYGNRQLANKITELGHFLKPLEMELRDTKKGFVFMCRIGYIIGNIIETYDYARILFFEDSAIMAFFIENLEFYANGNVQNRSEVLIKLIRIVANLSINPYVGSSLGNSSLGVILLHMLLRVKELKTTESEELLEAILGSIHNIVYYLYSQCDTENYNSENPGSFYQRINDIASALFDIIQGGYSNYSRLEAANILGNISRLTNINFITEKKMRILISCLQCRGDSLQVSDIDAETTAFSIAVIGILVNILADWETRMKFRDLNGLIAIRKILLQALHVQEWSLATLCCQAFWNILTDCKVITEEMTEEEGHLIANSIANNLDEQTLFNASPPEDWEPFAMVASDLLERFQFLLLMN